eukprot:1237433-Rhodomonas_salina.2
MSDSEWRSTSAIFRHISAPCQPEERQTPPPLSPAGPSSSVLESQGPVSPTLSKCLCTIEAAVQEWKSYFRELTRSYQKGLPKMHGREKLR